MFRRRNIFIAILLIMSIMVTACGGSGGKAKKASAEDNFLVIAQDSESVSMDPQNVTDQYSYRVFRQIYDPLVVTTEEKEIVPGLAKTWEQIDENTWVFELEEGVKFHNGEELKASDVKFTLDRYLTLPIVSHRLEAVKEINVLDDYKVEIVTERPFAALLTHLSHATASILNEKAVNEFGEDYGQNPVGTGPFKFEEWAAGDHITLVKYDDYYQGPAKIDGIIFKNIPEGTNRVIGLETDEIDIVYDVVANDKVRVEENENLVYRSEPSYVINYLGFNNERAPFDDVRVRKAINYAINRDEIIEHILEGTGVKANSPLQKDVIGANPDLEGYDYDPEKARELLKEAGLEDGFEMRLVSSEDAMNIRTTEMIQAQLKEFNIDVTLDVIEWGAFLETLGAGNEDSFILGWTTSTGDADNGLGGLYNSKLKGPGGNRFFYDNKEVDELLAKGSREMDTELRNEYFAKAQEIIMEDAPNALLYYSNYNMGLQKNVKGFKIHPGGTHRLYSVYFED